MADVMNSTTAAGALWPDSKESKVRGRRSRSGDSTLTCSISTQILENFLADFKSHREFLREEMRKELNRFEAAINKHYAKLKAEGDKARRPKRVNVEKTVDEKANVFSKSADYG